jgi:hypothetical protein
MSANSQRCMPCMIGGVVIILIVLGGIVTGGLALL